MVPRGYWKKIHGDSVQQKQIIDWLGQQLSVKQVDDWYRISLQQVQRFTKIETAELIIQMLQTVYPTHYWDTQKLMKFGKPVKASQRLLTIAVQHLFPQYGKFSRL